MIIVWPSAGVFVASAADRRASGAAATANTPPEFAHSPVDCALRLFARVALGKQARVTGRRISSVAGIMRAFCNLDHCFAIRRTGNFGRCRLRIQLGILLGNSQWNSQKLWSFSSPVRLSIIQCYGIAKLQIYFGNVVVNFPTERLRFFFISY